MEASNPEDARAANAVGAILAYAATNDFSEVAIAPSPEGANVSYQVGGVRKEVGTTIPAADYEAVVRRLKAMAALPSEAITGTQIGYIRLQIADGAWFVTEEFRPTSLGDIVTITIRREGATEAK